MNLAAIVDGYKEPNAPEGGSQDPCARCKSPRYKHGEERVLGVCPDFVDRRQGSLL